MDEADVAQAQEARSRESAIAYARSNSGPAALAPCGACHYCGEALSAGVFCPPVDDMGDGCARDHAALKAAEKRNGGR